MKDYLKSLIWFSLSNKLKLSVSDSKTVILDMYKRFKNDNHFVISNYDLCTIEAFEFYLEIKELLND